MDLLECYIEEIHNVKDITDNIIALGHMPQEPIYQVELTYDCCGRIRKAGIPFTKSQWEEAQEKGYFLA